MKRKAIGGGAYVDEQGRYWARPCIDRRWTWRLLYDEQGKLLKTRRAAIAKASNTQWQPSADNFNGLAKLYLDAGCPTRKMESRTAAFITAETARVKMILQFFGRYPCDEIRLKLIPTYATWRMSKVRYGTGERTVDKDLCTLSNILNYGIAIGEVEINWVRVNRTHYRKATDVRHSRECMPDHAEMIHQMADYFLESSRSEGMAWLTFFAMFSGCRTSELLRLRMDAQDETEPGFVKMLPAGHPSLTKDCLGYLYLGRRSKNGLNPWIMLGPEAAQMVECFMRWHGTRHARSPWFFPGAFDEFRLDAGAHGHALTRAVQKLKLPHHITPHGMRAYYVTKGLREGRRPAHIAAEIGDKTVSLITTTYGDHAGGDPLHWTPKDGRSAWLVWTDTQQKIVRL